MLEVNIQQLEKEVDNLQQIKRQLLYYAGVEQYTLDLVRLDISLVNLTETIKMLKQVVIEREQSELSEEEKDEDKQNPFIRKFRTGSANPYIKRFGGKRDSTSRGLSGISSET